MHELALARAALPAPTVCLGMLLREYSLAHELWLIRENNSVLRGSPDGLSAAVLICCQSWTELKAMRSDPLLRFKLWLWRRRVHKESRKSSRYHARELERFTAYRNEGLLEFPLSQVTRTDRGPALRLPGTPFILRIQQWLMTQFELTEPQAWDYPAGLAKMRWTAHWEAEGGLEVFNAHDAEEAEFISYWEARGGPSAMKRKEGAD